jgi:hypothetical protein
MARIIPDLTINEIENRGERLFYQACKALPPEYTVMYSFKYREANQKNGHVLVKEADFVVVHPDRGFITIEVKTGEVSCIDGVWQYTSDGSPLRKDPVSQAVGAYHAILGIFKESQKISFGPKADYCIAFPECSNVRGILPPHIAPDNVFLQNDLDNLHKKISDIFSSKKIFPNVKHVTLLQNMLIPSFNIFTQLEEKINLFNKKADEILTDEQTRILDETIEKRMVFLGGAGTGKTFIAIEKAKQLAKQQKKVLLTCYSSKLPNHLLKQEDSNIHCTNFHDFITKWLQENGYKDEMEQAKNECKSKPDVQEYYDEVLPLLFLTRFHKSDEDSYDAIIVDEGQDFSKDWLDCLEPLLKEDSIFYIFADERQNIFKRNLDFEKFGIHRRALTRNFRNTKEIHKELVELTKNYNYYSHKEISLGQKVKLFKWTSFQEQKKLIKKEVGRLVQQGISAGRILILSPNKQHKSSLKDVKNIKSWSVVPFGEAADNNAIRFETIRSFKGLEADIVFLTDIREDEKVCTLEDIYVGTSRAKYLLYMFVQEDCNLDKLPSYFNNKLLKTLDDDSLEISS